MASPPSTPKSITCTNLSGAASMFRQVDYFDGKNVCIAESHRRQHVSRADTSMPSFISSCDTNKTDERGVPSSHGSQTQSSLVEASSSPKASKPRAKRHVTSRARGTKAKTLIIQQSLCEDRTETWVEQHAKARDVLTPPPTPRISRLPTPDLEDRVDMPFCKCCSGREATRFCSWCGKKLDENCC